MSHCRATVCKFNLHWKLIGVGLLSLLLYGCGSGQSGPERFVLSGKVTQDGQPVAAGEVVLMPDTAKGNKGPGAVGTITDGTWKTTADKGPVSGPHIVMLTGYSSAEATEPGGAPPLLFAEYKTNIDVTADASNIDFDVPRKKQ